MCSTILYDQSAWFNTHIHLRHNISCIPHSRDYSLSSSSTKFKFEYYGIHVAAITLRRRIEESHLLAPKLTLSHLRAFWWSRESLLSFFCDALQLIKITEISNINFAIAGGFMISMLLTSVDDNEVEYWSSEIKLYQDLLESHSVNFVTTKPAAARMGVINGIRKEENLEDAAGVRKDFCEDFRMDFI